MFDTKGEAAWDSVLIATGEIGKKPAIHLYSWAPSSRTFCSLACMQGYHTRGVAQLAFSADGTKLFSVGVEYTVALYNTDRTSPQLGKMISSSQGPKGKVLHVSSCSPNGDKPDSFYSCGEKHVCYWNTASGLKYEACRLDKHKNKQMMCVTRGMVSAVYS